MTVLLAFGIAIVALPPAAAEVINTCQALPSPTHMDVKQVSSNYDVTTVLATTEARSNIECIIMCKISPDCISVFYNSQTGICSLLDEIQYSPALGNAVSMAGGMLTNVVPRATDLDLESNLTVCNGSPCLVSGRCREDCDLNEPFCLGESTDCDETPMFNIQQWSGTSVHAHDTGVVVSTTYTKTKDASGLYLLWSGTLRAAYNCAGCCASWTFTIDGAECSNPSPIDYAEYHASRKDYHHHVEFFGICYGISTGTRTIALKYKDCDGTVRDSYVGWQARWRFIMAEVAETTGSATCESQTAFNIQQFAALSHTYTTNENIHSTSHYVKRAADTALRVRWSGNLYGEGNQKCSRWYFKFNGVECSNPGSLEWVFYVNGGHVPQVKRGFAFNGICEGIGSGAIVITLHVGNCTSSGYPPYDAETGWKTTTHLIVEETRLGQDISAVLAANGTTIRLPFYNRVQGYWYDIFSDADSGTIQSITYNKKSSTSGIHVIWSVNVRIAGNAKCARWSVTFNGAQCSNPGSIEHVMYLNDVQNAAASYWHLPGIVDGICLGVGRGDVTIALLVGTCPSHHGSNAFTGWRSGTFLMVEEVFLGV
ncbi:uncharacterized protein LOC106180315 [Lingula anatina]|uniref:Uncharacterized protein LOC106180315 n=1 Tax=Lingula anatina TaxID=7574 RepID=A0A1S3KAQ8_LINAN|nr:uncharacterized protein LOC106180315 [Lingula anatina]|eukprot:XP_013419728.1 uncharacterized protein LOC106180315 [Lingula anatina]